MVPPKKYKKKKNDSKQLKKTKNKKKGKPKSIRPPVPLENGAAIDSDWWNSFWTKNSSTPGIHYSLISFKKKKFVLEILVS